MRPGATAGVAIRFVRPTRVADEVVEIDASDVSVRRAFPIYSSFELAELAALWPGHWTVSARRGDEVLAKGEMDLDGTGTFQATLTAGGSPTP